MKNLKLAALSTSVAILLSSQNVLALTCSQKPSNLAKAKECAEEFLTKRGDLWTLVETKKHTGDVSKCTETLGTTETKSYFTEKESKFTNSLKTASVGSCVEHKYDDDAFVCFIIDGPDACFLQSGKYGKETNGSFMSIGKTSGNLITFFPN